MNHYSIRAREIGSTGIFFPVLVRSASYEEALQYIKDVMQMETNGFARTIVCGQWVKCKEVTS